MPQEKLPMKTKDMKPTLTLTPAQAFFFEHAGYSYGQGETPEQGRTRGAIALAEHEARASAAGVSFRWEPDGMTNRERVEATTGPGTCGQGCHSTVINPPGFAFESFDELRF